MQRVRVLTVMLVAVVGLGGAGVSQAATISTSTSDVPPAAVSNPDVPLEVIESLPEVIQNDPTVQIPADFELTGPIIYPDGTAVEGQTQPAARAAAACGASMWGPPALPGTITWGAEAQSNCAVWGSPGAKLNYSWARAPGGFTTGCVKVTGNTSSGSRVWYSAGCGTSNTYQVLWGNVLDYPRGKAMSQGVLAGFSASYSH